MTLSNKFEVEKDLHSWRLTYIYLGKDKDGNEKHQRKSTWHADIKQVAKAVVNYEAGESSNMRELMEIVSRCEQLIENKLLELKDA